MDDIPVHMAVYLAAVLNMLAAVCMLHRYEVAFVTGRGPDRGIGRATRERIGNDIHATVLRKSSAA